ncbi:DUF4168 domain-containing protein [Vampirovibrio sp.]|uniref:DUF4168 domain-containing protein n=1 Tax=Vampirovibrio sp. TaxID=2717857 RepID=UPI003594008F
MKSMIQNTVALSICGFMLTGAALAASPQPTAAPNAQDAQLGEVAKIKETTPSTAPNAPAAEATHTQSNQPQTPNPQTAASASSPYSDAELKNFVDAAKGVDQVKLKYEDKLSSAKGQTEIDKIKKEADAELSKAVEAKGISVEQYNKIHQSAMQDPQLLSRIQKYM